MDKKLYYGGHRGHGAHLGQGRPNTLRALRVLRGQAFVSVALLFVSVVGAGGMAAPGAAQAPALNSVTATRIAQNPLITINSSRTLGDNVNGPAIIRVPSW